MIFNLTATPRDFRKILMGQGSKPATWSTCGGWRWKEEDSIREKEAPEWEGTENWKGKTL